MAEVMVWLALNKFYFKENLYENKKQTINRSADALCQYQLLPEEIFGKIAGSAASSCDQNAGETGRPDGNFSQRTHSSGNVA